MGYLLRLVAVVVAAAETAFGAARNCILEFGVAYHKMNPFAQPAFALPP